MIDATDLKAHSTASSLNKGAWSPPDWWAKGGMSSKLHGVCHSKGRPQGLHLPEGQCSDFPGAGGVLKDLPPAAAVIGDQGYDSDKIRKVLAEQGISSCIPPAPNSRSITTRRSTEWVTKARLSFPD